MRTGYKAGTDGERAGWALTVLLALGAALALWALPGCAVTENLRLPEAVNAEAQGPMVAGAFQEEPQIRVRIKKGVASVEIAGPATVILREAGASVGRPEVMRTPVQVSGGAGGITATGAGNERRTWGAGERVEVLVADGRNDGLALSAAQSLRIGGTAYPGYATVMGRVDGGSGLDVVVTMGVEAYIPGVLTHELFKDWPRQTYAAQAVAARTYALHERWRAQRENRAFDVEDYEADQVYGGATTSVVANEATRTTRGMVITDKGRLIRAYYSSTCGGRPASASDTWPRKPNTDFNLAAPLQAREREHACQQATFYRWTVRRSDNDVSQRLRTWGRAFSHPVAQVGRVRSIEVHARNDAMRPMIHRLTDETGRTYDMTAEELRMGVNQAVQGLPAITRENRVHSGDVAVTVWADQVTFTGRGWGHSVGMCQWCAKGFADLGRDWRAMITMFYPRAEVVQAY